MPRGPAPFRGGPLALAPLLTLAALAGPALADPAAECRDRSLPLEAQLAACTTAAEAASDPAERGDLLAIRARAHRLLGDSEAAARDAEEAIRLAPSDPDPLIERGYLERNAGDLAAAVATAEAALALDPGYWRGLLIAMDFHTDAGDYGRCMALAADAVRIASERAETWAYRGRCLAELGRDEEAVADYERAAEIGVAEAYLHDNLSMAYLRLGRAAEAEAAARVALSHEPDHWSANVSLIEALMAQGKVEEAIAAWEAGEAAIAEDEPDLANDMAWLLYRAGEHERALSVIGPWIAAHPEPAADQHYEVDTHAHVLAALGRAEEAAAEWRRAAAIGGPEKRATLERALAALGFAPGTGDDAAFEAALRACAATGAACLLDG